MMDPVELFMQIGNTLKITQFSSGNIKLNFSKKSLPLLKQFAQIPSLKNISAKQFISFLTGINEVKVNILFASITVEFDPNEWTRDMWDNLCQGKCDSVLSQIITDAIKKSSEQ